MSTENKVSVEEVTDALKDVYDPEIPVNIVDLGLIYGVEISDQSDVQILMTLTAAGCGMGPFIAQQAEWAVAEVDGVNEQVAREALNKASAKLPIKCKFVKRI